MKINKIKILAFVLIILVAVVGCTPNDTGMNTRNRNLSTQTRINDTRWDTDRDNLNNMGQNDMWNNGRNYLNQNDMTNNDWENGLNNGMTRPNNNINARGDLNNNANDIARKIADLPEVDKASVVLTNDTALVGCSLRGSTQGTMTTSLRQKIKKIVKDTTANITNVSITTDPNLYNRIQTMSNDIGNGNPIEGFAEEVRDLIRRITPNNTTR